MRELIRRKRQTAIWPSVIKKNKKKHQKTYNDPGSILHGVSINTTLHGIQLVLICINCSILHEIF